VLRQQYILQQQHAKRHLLRHIHAASTLQQLRFDCAAPALQPRCNACMRSFCIALFNVWNAV
jgi:hypothetical protein